MQFDIWNNFRKNAKKIIYKYLPVHSKIIDLFSSHELSSMPNILLYCRSGFPVDVLWEEGLKNIISKNKNLDVNAITRIENVFEEIIPYNDCHYFIEIDFAHPDISKDNKNISNFLKSIIETRCIHLDRHILVLRNIDNLFKDYSFRIILERFSKSAIFICTTSRMQLDDPLTSRFLSIRVPLPTETEITCIINLLKSDENSFANLNISNNNTITPEPVGRDLIKAIFNINTKINPDYNNLYSYPPLPVEFTCKPSIEVLRELAYKICQYNISIADIAIDILHELKKRKKPPAYISDYISNAAKIEHMYACSQKGKEPIYIECLLHAAAYGKIYNSY